MSINCEIRQIVELLNMKPSFSTQHELRFGTKGSLSINTKDNTWFDFEAQTGGGMLDFLVHCGKAKSQQDAAKWLEEHGLIAPIRQRQSARRCNGRIFIVIKTGHH